MSENHKEEFQAPVLYGNALRAVVNMAEYLPFLRTKLASDAQLYSLRERHDIQDHPTTLPIPLEYFHAPKDAIFDQPILKLDAKHKSISSFSSFWDYHEAYTQFNTTPTKVAEKLVLKLENSKASNYIRFVCQDIAEQAKASTERYKSQKPLSQMDGVFVSIKEELDIKGLETKVGTCFINDGNPATEDSTIVTRLREAGAIIIGSAVMNELGWDTFTVNYVTGTPKNPYGASHSCGGSSGGSSGSVAGGLVPVSIGADGGGSIRIPASFCGLYGLKTTFARVSAYGGATEDPTLGAYGPIAATADDMALTYSIISGPDAKDSTTLLQAPVNLKDYDSYSNLSDLTIAVTPDWNKGKVKPEILQQLDLFKNALSQLGARIVEVDIPDVDVLSTAHSITICSEMYNFASRYPDQHTSFSYYTRMLTCSTSALDSRDYLRAQQVRTRLMNNMRNIFENQKVDLILCPTSITSPEIPAEAHSHGMCNVNLTNESMMFCRLANLTGLPGLNVPAGFHEGMPIGLQFMATWWNEALLCRIAKACERLRNIERKRPSGDHWYGDDLLQ